jgi:hypothetical protein
MKTVAFGLLNLMFAFSAAAAPVGLPSYIVKTKKEFKALEAQMKKAGGDEKIWLRWQVALNAPQVGELKKGIAALDALLLSKQTMIGTDQIELNRGRILFQKGDFEGAIEAYQAVPKSSEYWFEALEEEAWSYIRLQQPDRATAKLATLLSPIFQAWVGPETYFAANYNALKVCDYPSIFKNGKSFKERHSARIKELERLSKSGTNSVIAAALPRLESGELKFMAYSKEALGMPRFFWRDEFLRRHVSQLQELKNSKSEKQIAKIRGDMITRLKALAKAELSEYKTVIQKLHVIEAEVIQRMYLDESLKGERPRLEKAGNDPNVLKFPYTDEVWLDEIDSYQALVKECPQLKEAKYEINN